MTIKNIAVVGASGRMGSEIVSAMLSEGILKVTAITRTDSAATFPDGIAVQRVDYDDPSSLTAALTGQDALIITMSNFAPKTHQLRLVEAAAAAKVRWVMPNWYAQDIRQEQLLRDANIYDHITPILRRIEELGVSSWVSLCCGFWYEWSLSGTPYGLNKLLFGFDLKARELMLFDDGHTKINMSTWKQTGLAIARLFALKESPDGPEDVTPTLSQFRNGPVYISSFTASQKDLLASVLRVTGTKEKDWKIDSENHRERYDAGLAKLKAGVREGFAIVLYTRVFFPNGDGNFGARRGLQNELLGLPEEDIDAATRAAFEYVNIPLK